VSFRHYAHRLALTEERWQLRKAARYTPSLVHSEDVGNVGIGFAFTGTLIRTCYDRAMDNASDVHVSVLDDALVVTMPGTTYSITYRKATEPWLLASNIRDDKDSSVSKWTFRAQAWTAANEKARDLGWIV
jgi:hypothetical protein